MAQSLLLHTRSATPVSPAHMMPLVFLRPGEAFTVHTIKGKDETTRLLEELGFVEGCTIKLVSSLGGNLIVEVKGSRIALNKQMAGRIIGC